MDLASDPHNCGACGSACNTDRSCSSGQCDAFPTCPSDAPACVNEHGQGGCCPGICYGNPMMVQCLPTCTNSSECAGGCCKVAGSGRASCDLPGTNIGCLCTTSSDCPTGQACAPATNGSGDPVGPMVCSPNDGMLHHGCNDTTVCSEGCCVADTHGNRFCAAACVDATTCGAAHCDPYDFSHGTCAGPTACGP